MTSVHSISQRSSSMSSDEEVPVATLNGTYDLIKVIGKGSTCKVWLARYSEDPTLEFAIKILSSSYLKLKNSRKNVNKEVEILSSLDQE